MGYLVVAIVAFLIAVLIGRVLTEEQVITPGTTPYYLAHLAIAAAFYGLALFVRHQHRQNKL